jgi:hypothetical protein
MLVVMLRVLFQVVVAVGLCGVLGCTSTRVESTWKDPSVTRSDFTKLLLVAPAPDGVGRRQTEDALAAAITAVPVVASYRVVTDGATLAASDALLAAAKSVGADGVVVLRVVTDRSEVSVLDGGVYPAPYRAFRGYYGPSHGLAPLVIYQPTQTVTRRVLSIETNLTRVADGMLVWSGLTTTTGDLPLPEAVREVVTALRERLVHDGLVVPALQ